MKPEVSYRLCIRWSEVDRVYVGDCPDLFPWGGVCHGTTKKATSVKLRTLVREEMARLEKLWDKAFKASRRRLMPAARAQGIHTDADVFRTVS